MSIAQVDSPGVTDEASPQAAPGGRQRFRRTVEALIRAACPSHGISLDLGCGVGHYHAAYANRVLGLEPSVAVHQVPDGIRGTMERLPFQPSCADFITCFQTLYYVPDLAGALAELTRVARPNARVLISVSKPRSIARVEQGAQHLQRHSARGWLQQFRTHGMRAHRLFPNPTTGPTLLRWAASRALALASPYMWFQLEIRKGEVA